MKRAGFAFGMIVLALAVAAWAQTSAQPKGGSVAEELVSLENGWNTALVKRDWAYLDRILADDFVNTSSAGIVKTKAQTLATLKSDETVIMSEVADDFKVRVYGDTAVVTFHNAEISQLKGKDTSQEERVTDVWVKIAGRWQCVAGHASKIAPK